MEAILKDANQLLKKVRDKYYDKSQDECMNEPNSCAKYRNSKFQNNHCLFSSRDENKCYPKLSPICEDKPEISLFSNTSLNPSFYKAYFKDIPTTENLSNSCAKPSYSKWDSCTHDSIVLQKNDTNVLNPTPIVFSYPKPMMKQNFPILSQCSKSTMNIQPNCPKCSINKQCLYNDSKLETMNLKKQVELAKLDLECKQRRVEDRRLRLEKVYKDLECNN